MVTVKEAPFGPVKSYRKPLVRSKFGAFSLQPMRSRHWKKSISQREEDLRRVSLSIFKISKKQKKNLYRVVKSFWKTLQPSAHTVQRMYGLNFIGLQKNYPSHDPVPYNAKISTTIERG
jgi:hypothetical protein